MSSALRHVSQGMAGATGAPRPTLVNAAGGVSAREHERDMATTRATTSAPRPARVALNSLICDIRVLTRAIIGPLRRSRRGCSRMGPPLDPPELVAADLPPSPRLRQTAEARRAKAGQVRLEWRIRRARNSDNHRPCRLGAGVGRANAHADAEYAEAGH